MKTLKEPKDSRRRGISLSISKNSSSLSKNQNSLPKPVNQMHYSCQIPQNIQTRKSISVIRPPVIIYRYRKSEWEQLQERNIKKREQVKNIKNQLQNLNIQLLQWKNKQPKKEYFSCRTQLQKSSKNQIPIEKIALNTQTSHRNILVENFNVQNCYPITKQIEKKHMRSFNGEDTLHANQIKIIQSVDCKQVKNENINLFQKNMSKGKIQSLGQRKTQNRIKNLQIDLNSLQQIQNRLNKLIDFTTTN